MVLIREIHFQSLFQIIQYIYIFLFWFLLNKEYRKKIIFSIEKENNKKGGIILENYYISMKFILFLCLKKYFYIIKKYII